MKEYNELNRKRMDVEYATYDAYTGQTDYKVGPPKREKIVPARWEYKGVATDFLEVYRDPGRRQTLLDVDNWACNGVRGTDIFTNRDIQYCYGCAELSAWSLRMQQRQKLSVSDTSALESKIQSYVYTFSTVKPESFLLAKNKSEEAHWVGGTQIFAHRVDRIHGTILPLNIALRDFFYDLECKKALAYLQTHSKCDSSDDWLYSLGMYQRHIEDYRRIASALGPGPVISYGDRVGALDVDKAMHWDRQPSAYAIRQVVRCTESDLKSVTRNPAQTIVLSFVYTQLSESEKELIRTAKAKVIIWSDANVCCFPNEKDGVSSNFPMTISGVTDKTLDSYLPYSENFALLPDRVYLDPGPGLDWHVRSKIYDRIPIAKKAFPNLESISGLPVERRSPAPGGAYIAHTLDLWRKYRGQQPYFVPIGRVVSRILPVSVPMSEYQERTLYALAVGQHGFRRELSSGCWVTLLEAADAITGFFSRPISAPGILVSPLGANAGHDITFVEFESSYEISCRDNSWSLKKPLRLVDLAIFYDSLTSVQRDSITKHLTRDYSFSSFLALWKKVT